MQRSPPTPGAPSPANVRTAFGRLGPLGINSWFLPRAPTPDYPSSHFDKRPAPHNHDEETIMAGYAVFDLRQVTDSAKMDEYRSEGRRDDREARRTRSGRRRQVRGRRGIGEADVPRDPGISQSRGIPLVIEHGDLCSMGCGCWVVGFLHW